MSTRRWGILRALAASLALGALVPACTGVPVVAVFEGMPTKLVADDASGDDLFGTSIAIDGDTAVIGAAGDDLAGTDRGSAYVFTWDGAAWTQQAKLVADDGADNDNFGYAVDVDSVEGRIVVGAPGHAPGGAAYVFTRPGWSQQAKLEADDAAANDRFGISVAVDGRLILVGAYGSDPGGAAYAFWSIGGQWPQTDKLTASDAGSGDQFGRSVALEGSYAATAVVGADSYDAGGVNRGGAYVFTRPDSTSPWVQRAILTADDAGDNDQLGRSVALDADTIVVGAYGDDLAGSEEGSAYVFTRNGVAWSQEAKLVANDAASGAYFGISVAVDGDTALAGAYVDDLGTANEGSAYVFVRDQGAWDQRAKLSAPDGAENDFFGRSVALEGDVAMIGANGDDLAVADEGSVYVFAR